MKKDERKLRFGIATNRKWGRQISNSLLEQFPQAEIVEFFSKEELTSETLLAFSPSYIFFPHWSYLIPEEIFERFACVIFHMTDLPFGRGGSPLQNLISRGIFETKISALRCVKELDAGPIYMKRDLSLHGNAEEIYLRAMKVIEQMIVEIVRTDPIPVPQVGDVTLFSRRQPEESSITSVNDLENLFHHIRMLDAEGYPKAFLQTEHFRLEFSRASFHENKIIADVEIRENNK